MASCAAAAVVGVLATHRLMPPDVRRANNAATRQTAETEAAAAEEVYRLASRLPEPGRSRVQDAAVSYIRAVVEEEWPAMEWGRPSAEAGARADSLQESVQGIDPRTPAEVGISWGTGGRVYWLAYPDQRDGCDVCRLHKRRCNTAGPALAVRLGHGPAISDHRGVARLVGFG